LRAKGEGRGGEGKDWIEKKERGEREKEIKINIVFLSG
jgi:hypothetical protein